MFSEVKKPRRGRGQGRRERARGNKKKSSQLNTMPKVKANKTEIISFSINKFFDSTPSLFSALNPQTERIKREFYYFLFSLRLFFRSFRELISCVIVGGKSAKLVNVNAPRENRAKNKNATERNGFEDETRWEKLAGKNVQELWRRPRKIFPHNVKTR